MRIFLVQDTGQNARFNGQCKSFMTSAQMAMLGRVPHTRWWNKNNSTYAHARSGLLHSNSLHLVVPINSSSNTFTPTTKSIPIIIPKEKSIPIIIPKELWSITRDSALGEKLTYLWKKIYFPTSFFIISTDTHAHASPTRTLTPLPYPSVTQAS